MKITLSKSQWEMIGKKAGWMGSVLDTINPSRVDKRKIEQLQQQQDQLEKERYRLWYWNPAATNMRGGVVRDEIWQLKNESDNEKDCQLFVQIKKIEQQLKELGINPVNAYGDDNGDPPEPNKHYNEYYKSIMNK